MLTGHSLKSSTGYRLAAQVFPFPRFELAFYGNLKSVLITVERVAKIPWPRREIREVMKKRMNALPWGVEPDLGFKCRASFDRHSLFPAVTLNFFVTVPIFKKPNDRKNVIVWKYFDLNFAGSDKEADDLVCNDAECRTQCKKQMIFCIDGLPQFLCQL